MKLTHYLLFFGFLLLQTFNSYAQNLYVDINATGSNDGSSWSNAYTDLQDALDSNMVLSVDSILIAEGIYYPTSRPNGTGSSIDWAFHLADSNVIVVGGYDASENTRTGTSTILSGDLVTAGTGSDTVHHILVTVGLSSASSFEHIVFKDSRADGNNSLTYESNTIERDNGGAFYNYSSSPNIKNCIFSINYSKDKGGAIYNVYSSPAIYNCVFENNSSNSKGGAVFNGATSGPAISNCVFTNNVASVDGGGIFSNSSSLASIINCTFINNTANRGGALRSETTSSEVINNLFFGNTASSSDSAVSGSLSTSSTNNASDFDSTLLANNLVYLNGFFNKDIFKDSSNLKGADGLWMTSDDGLRLFSSSLVEKRGDDSGTPANDITGNARPSPPSIGAYERDCDLAQSVLYVDSAASGNNTGLSWANAYTDLQDALDLVMICSGIDSIHIAEGTYYPSRSYDPTVTNARRNAFHLADSNVVVIGGYDAAAGTQTGDCTILSGDLLKDGIDSNRANHIFVTHNLSASTEFINLSFTYGAAFLGSSLFFNGQFVKNNYGGCMQHLSSSPTIDGCTFTKSIAKWGAGGAMYLLNSAAIIKNCEFSFDSAALGGAVFFDSCSSKMNNCKFFSDTASNGGSIYVQGGDITIDGCCFEKSTTGDDGGAIFLDEGQLEISSSVFANNEARYGGVLYEKKGKYKVLNSLFVNNDAFYGGVICESDDAVTVKDSIINSSFVGNSGFSYGVYHMLGNHDEITKYTHVSNSLFFKNTSVTSNRLRDSGRYNASDLDLIKLVMNPKKKGIDLSSYHYKDIFVDSSNLKGPDGKWMTDDDGLVLLATSPVRNMGDNKLITGNSKDIRNMDRIIDGTVDIGAYEATTNGLILPTDSGIHQSNYSFDVDEWTYYIDTPSMDLLLALDLSGTGAVVHDTAVQLKIGGTKTISWVDSGGIVSNPSGGAMINRYWDVKASTQPTSLVGVKYYFTEAEYDALKDTLANHNGGASGYPSTLTSVTDLNFFKLTDTTAFKDPHSSGATGIVLFNHASVPDTNQWIYSAFDQNHSAEFKVNSFSGGGGGQGGGGGTGIAPLPVELIKFEARTLGSHQGVLNWVTAAESNNSHFDIYRSYDKEHFEQIGSTTGAGNSSDIVSYQFIDNSIDLNQNQVYYYLSQIDFDGTISNSDIKSIRFDQSTSISNISVFPNPFKQELQIAFGKEIEDELKVEIYNSAGQLIQKHRIFNQLTSLDFKNLEQGFYTLKITENNHNNVYRIFKM